MWIFSEAEIPFLVTRIAREKGKLSQLAIFSECFLWEARKIVYAPVARWRSSNIACTLLVKHSNRMTTGSWQWTIHGATFRSFDVGSSYQRKAEFSKCQSRNLCICSEPYVYQPLQIAPAESHEPLQLSMNASAPNCTFRHSIPGITGEVG